MSLSEQTPIEQPAYVRSLPSGGYVAIATESVQPLFAPARIRGRVIVERRCEERRVGHRAPIAAIAERDNLDEVLAALVPVAESDEFLADTLARGVTMPITRRRSQSG
jgi:hypothetical protein